MLLRQGRTFLPNAADCPLCVMSNNEAPTDIPVDDYEVAIFTNRFSALSHMQAHHHHLKLRHQLE